MLNDVIFKDNENNLIVARISQVSTPEYPLSSTPWSTKRYQVGTKRYPFECAQAEDSDNTQTVTTLSQLPTLTDNRWAHPPPIHVRMGSPPTAV